MVTRAESIARARAAIANIGGRNGTSHNEGFCIAIEALCAALESEGANARHPEEWTDSNGQHLGPNPFDRAMVWVERMEVPTHSLECQNCGHGAWCLTVCPLYDAWRAAGFPEK
jgi:Fe-S-cluster-containing hydrogenase component 2